MKKVLEVSALNPNATYSWPNVSTLFFSDQEVDNYKYPCF